ncbi:MMPL family transporter [Streptomyces sp. NPDC057638]|uniref:MMPL family transporter n=1 Tax=Streptomyces sp. NPDC057638 TaxID=3346190 RepID=UPI0036A386E2
MVRSLTALAVRHRWVTIVVWFLLGAALTVTGQSMMYDASGSQASDFLPREYGSAAALRIAEEEFGEKPDPNAVTMLVAREDGGKLTAADRGRIGAVAKELGARQVIAPKPEIFLMTDHSQVPKVGLGAPAPDGSFQLLTATLTGNAADPGLQDVYRAFRADAKAAFGQEGLRAGFTGGIANSVDAFDAGEIREKVIGAVTMGLIVLINVLVFRSPLAAFLPLVAVALVGGVASGAVAGTALLFDIELDASIPSLIAVVLLGIGIDYFLFLLFRFRELLRDEPGIDSVTAATRTAGRVGNAITSAALTIVAAFATLGLASFGQFRVLGPAIAVSVLVMLLASLTLMPALLAVTGRGMFWPARAWRRQPSTDGTGARLGHAIAHRPGRWALASVLVLVALAAGSLGITMNYDQPAHDKTAATRTADEIADALPAGAADQHTVYIRSGDGPLDAAALTSLTSALGRTDGVGQVGRPLLSDDRTAARLDVALSVVSDSQRARDLITGPIRTTLAQAAPDGTEAHITGTAAVYADIATAVDKDLRLVFPVAAGLILLILLVLLRSLVAPLILMLAVGLGFAATLGASTLLFQHLLDRPGVMFTLPLVLFLFVVALGTDYTILVTDRLREEMALGRSSRDAVAETLRHTTPTITTAGFILAASFATLVVNPANQEIGFATTLGILLASLLLSLLLVPSLASLLGPTLWWPTRPTHPRHRGPHPETPERDAYREREETGVYGRR